MVNMGQENIKSNGVDISLIILHYNGREVALNCLDSIKTADFSLLNREIIVVDNASNDGLVELLEIKHPDVKIIRNAKNIGMGAGNNIGIREATGKYIVIMNPDTIAAKDVFRRMFDFLEANPDVGMAGPKQFNPDGTVQDSSYRWHSLLTPLYRRTPLGKLKCAQKDLNRFLMKDFDRASIKEIDWLLGSFLFCRAEALKEVGYFDEIFFLYFEDTDLSRRFWEKGWKVVYYPDAQIIHNHSRLSAQIPWYKFFVSRAGREHVISWVKYLRKWGIPELKI